MSSRPQSSAAPPNEKPTTADKENRVVSVIAPPKSPKSGKKKAPSSAGSKEAAPSRSASALKNPTSTKASTVSLGGKSAKSKSLAQISTNGSAKDKRPLSAKSMTLTPSVTTKSPLKQQPPEPVDVSKPLSSSEAVLMEACKTGDVDAVYNCVWEKVNLNCRLPYYGTTPLSMAFRHGHKQLCNVLINFGAKFDPDNYGATPVHWAASHGHSKLIKDQFQRGHISRPDLQRRDTFGSTPLHFASVNNLTDCVQTLLDCGSDSLVTNNDGRTASMITSDDGIRNILLEAEKYDTEMHRRREEEERAAAKLLLAEKKKKSRPTSKQQPLKPGSSGKPVVVGARKIMPVTTTRVGPETGPKPTAQPGPNVPKKGRASNAWTAAAPSN